MGPPLWVQPSLRQRNLRTPHHGSELLLSTAILLLLLLLLTMRLNQGITESSSFSAQVKAGQDPFEDPWDRLKNEKKDRIAKNEGQKLKNDERTGRRVASIKAVRSPYPAVVAFP